jgi:inhibitor of cysteine peptidase
MNRRLVAAACFAIVTFGFATSCSDNDNDDGAGYPDEVQLTDADNGSSTRLALGGELIVALSSNVTTGFSWSLAEESGSQLELIGEPRYAPPGSTSPVAGAAGTQVYTFAAKATGSAKLVLEYRRPFEPGVAPARTFSATIEIR